MRIFLSLFFILSACSTQQKPFIPRANDLVQKYILADGHIDFPYQMRKVKQGEISEYKGEFSYQMAQEGGLNLPFMSIYIPARVPIKEAKSYADELVSIVYQHIKSHPQQFELARTPAHVIKAKNRGKVTLTMGMENGTPIGDDLNNIDYFYKKGVKYIGLVHSRNNQMSDSVTDMPKWKGLSPLGKEAILRMNEIGMLIDVSHMSDQAFWDVMKLSRSPVIASHSSCRAIANYPRNISDEMLKAIAKNGGVVMINFGSFFLTNKSIEDWNRYVREVPKDKDSPEYKKYMAKLEKNFEYGTVSDVADHIDHVVKIAGIDHVGIGSDFDGVRFALPVGLKNVSQYPNLVSELIHRGYSDEQIEKILGANLLRVWGQNLRNRTR